MSGTTVKLPRPDQVIGGRYRLLARLGSGGMGLVFLAEQIGVGNRVAMKFLDPEPNADDSRVARFLREAKVSLEVKHPGATQLLDLGRDENLRLYLVFEYVEGRDLRELLKDEGRLRFEEAREITLKVAETLSFAHAHGIVHRDIKPENIRVRRDLAGVHVKVLDFGIARLLNDGGVRLTAEGNLAGTPRYMAPEQIRDVALDGRTDLYALGLVLFEMLAGTPAFTGKNVSQILLKQVQERMPGLRELVPELDFPAVDGLLARACAKDPDDRFPTMADFVAALRALPYDLVLRWPAPEPLPLLVAEKIPTKEARGSGHSDTLVRPDPALTEAAVPRPLLPTPQPPVSPVQRGPERATRPSRTHDLSQSLPHDEPPTEPDRPAVLRRPPPAPAPAPSPAPSPVTPYRPPPPVPTGDLPSLDRPGNATVVGVPVPTPPKRKSRVAVVLVPTLVLTLLAGLAAIAWWIRSLGAQ